MSANSKLPVTYDASGRMNFHPEFHVARKTPWTTADEQYLIENYAALGPEQISLALGRTVNTVTGRACELRKAGRMAKPAKRTYTRRSRSTSLEIQVERRDGFRQP